MPKVSHGPEPKAAPPSLSLLLREMRESNPFSFHYVDMIGGLESAVTLAETLEARLTELHDAVEFSIGKLNEVTAADDGTFADSDTLHEALARLNRVL